MLRLVFPSTKYKQSFDQSLQEYQDEQRHKDFDFPHANESLEEYIAREMDYSQGRNLPSGFVPSTILWLVDDNEYIGQVSVRHTLNEFLRKIGGHIGYVIRPSKRKLGYGKKILELALSEAKKMGINKVLLTCDETNIGSAKIIETNSGVLEDATDMGEGKPRKLRYWITL